MVEKSPEQRRRERKRGNLALGVVFLCFFLLSPIPEYAIWRIRAVRQIGHSEAEVAESLGKPDIVITAQDSEDLKRYGTVECPPDGRVMVYGFMWARALVVVKDGHATRVQFVSMHSQTADNDLALAYQRRMSSSSSINGSDGG